ncbi:hypothetical protein D9M68_532450 [compost metagenome]
MIRRLLTLWRRARRTGRDLDAVGYLAGAVAFVMLIATGIAGPTLDAQSTLTACEGCGKTAVAAKD